MQKFKQPNELQKITIYVPRKLLIDAQNIAHSNITDTVRNALQLFISEKASQNLRKLRGKIKFSININTLREDR